MSSLLDPLLLVAGLALLIKSADWLVQGAVALAQRWRLSPLVIGLTIVAFGTSLPELLVSLNSGVRGNADLAIANVIGSNIFNVLVVIGIAACIRPLPVRNQTVVTEIPFSLTAALLVGFLANAALFSSASVLSISRLDGMILLGFFLFFMLYALKVATEGPAETDERDTAAMSSSRTWLLIAVGVIGLYFGGELTVDGALGVAGQFGVDDALIGLTIIAAGTSAPELVASSMAAYRGQTDIAVGNVVGSNIFNLLWIIGITATTVPLPFEVVSNTDIVVMIGASALVIVALITSRDSTVNRWHGLVFLVLYLVYLAFVVQRG